MRTEQAPPKSKNEDRRKVDDGEWQTVRR